jgi:protein-disulfide isomerase
MTTNRPNRQQSGDIAPTSRASARRRLASKEANRALSRAGTNSSGSDHRPILIWSLIFALIAIVVVGAALLLTMPKNGADYSNALAPGVVTPSSIQSNGRTLGNLNAPVTIDLYGDFRCSACFIFTTKGAEKSIVDDYVATGKAKLVWHDYTIIDTIRGSTASRDAANAAWCAADQGKFWTMHDWLYANQSPAEAASAFTMVRLSDIGKAAGLDMSRYQPCLDNGTHNADIATEQANTPSNAGGTPSLFVNGQFVGDPTSGTVPSYNQIKAAIAAALASPAPSASFVASPS